MSLNQTSAPAAEPITTAEAKTHLRIDTNDEDTYIDSLVTAAREWAERFTGRAFVTQTWEWRSDAFPEGAEPFRVPYPRLASVTSITYLDVDGDSQTLATAVYEVDTASQPGRIALKYNESWPNVRAGVIDVVTVTFVAGYGDAAAVPGAIKHAIKFVVGHWFENREEVVVGVVGVMTVPLAAERLLWGYRMKLV